MRMTKDVYLATELLLSLTATPRRVSDLAEALDIATKETGKSKCFLSRIVNKLNRAGLVKVARGPHGGVALKADVNVNLFDIYTALGRPSFNTSPKVQFVNDILTETMKNISILTATQVVEKTNETTEIFG